MNPPYETTRGVPTLNTFVIYAASMTVLSGFTSNNLPAGITFFGMPDSGADAAQARPFLRAGNAPPCATEDHAAVEQIRSGVAAVAFKAVSRGVVSNPPAIRPT
jgi:hypothetical protein